MKVRQVRVSVFLDERLHRKVKLAATRTGTFVSAFIAETVAARIGTHDALRRNARKTAA